MNKRIAMLSVALLLIMTFASQAYALQVTDIQQNIESNTQEVTALKAELNAKIGELNSKIDALPTQEYINQALSTHLQIVNQIMDQFRMMLIVSMIVIVLCAIGVFYGIYFHFKARGRI